MSKPLPDPRRNVRSTVEPCAGGREPQPLAQPRRHAKYDAAQPDNQRSQKSGAPALSTATLAGEATEAIAASGLAMFFVKNDGEEIGSDVADGSKQPKRSVQFAPAGRRQPGS
jgi:hypothetical protein